MPVKNGFFMEKLVLFVCTGNTCRSPMAEAWFNHRAAELGLSGFRAVSAGLCAAPGAPASPQAREVMREAGVALDDFHSRPLTGAMLAAAELVVAMTDGHRRKILAAAPELRDRCFRLADFAGSTDIADPYGGTTEVYRQCFAAMRPALENLIEQLRDPSVK